MPPGGGGRGSSVPSGESTLVVVSKSSYSYFLVLVRGAAYCDGSHRGRKNSSLIWGHLGTSTVDDRRVTVFDNGARFKRKLCDSPYLGGVPWIFGDTVITDKALYDVHVWPL